MCVRWIRSIDGLITYHWEKKVYELFKFGWTVRGVRWQSVVHCNFCIRCGGSFHSGSLASSCGNSVSSSLSSTSIARSEYCWVWSRLLQFGARVVVCVGVDAGVCSVVVDCVGSFSPVTWSIQLCMMSL